MSSRLELLEKLVNKCNLSTQRATHTNIITVGGRVLNGVEYDRELKFQQELDEAVAAAEAKAERDKQRALMHQKQQLDEVNEKALQLQKKYYEQVAVRVAEQRDRLEAERISEVREQMEKERQEALQEQWELAQRERAQAIEAACQSLTKALNRQHRLDKELSIGACLKKAREGFKKRLNEAIESNTEKCAKAARTEAERVKALHTQEIQRHEIRYNELRDKYTREHKHRKKVDSDFLALQTDYQRFMDYTDGKFHSDYLMSLRRHGMKLSEKRLSDVSEYEPKQLQDINLSSYHLLS